MGSLYREKKGDLDQILSEVFENPAETDKIFEPIFDEHLKKVDAQHDSEIENKFPPLLDENLSEPEVNIVYIEIPEKKPGRKRKIISRTFNEDQLKKLPKVLKLMVDTIYDPIFEMKKENIVENILKNYYKDNDTLLVGLENLRNDLDGILGKKKPGRVCKNTKARVSYETN